MAIDPWGGFNDANAQLNNTLVNVRNQNRQDSLDALNAQAARQSLAMGGIQLQNVQRQQNDALSLRQQLAGLSPTSTTTLTPPVQSASPAQTLGVNNVITGNYGQGSTDYTNDSNIAGLKANVAANPQMAALSGSDQRLAAMQAQTPVITPANNQIAPETITPSPEVQAYNAGNVQTTTTTPDPFAVAAKFWSDRGEFDKAAAVMQAAKQHAEEQGNMAAVGSNNLTNYYTKIAKASLSATQSKQIESGLTTIAALAKEGPQYLKMAEPSIQQIPGFEKFSADSVSVDPSKRFSTIDMGGGQTVIIDALNPKDWKLEKKDPVTDLQIAVKGFDEANPNATAQQRAAFVKAHELDMARAKRQVIVNNPTNPAMAGGSMGGGAAGPLNSQGVNESALQGLSPSMAAYVKKVANYEIPLPNPRSKEGIALAGRVALFDPEYRADNFQLRNSVRKSFTSGKDAQNITSLNTAVHHLDQLDNSMTALGNRSMPLWNTLANKFEAATGDPKLIRAANDLNAVKGELAATFKGTGATDQEIKAWEGGFSSSSSPAQAKASIQEGVKLLQGRLDALIDKYQAGMGTTRDLQILSPKSIQTLQKLGVDVDRYKAYAKGGSNGTTGANQAPTSGPIITKGGFKVTVN